MTRKRSGMFAATGAIVAVTVCELPVSPLSLDDESPMPVIVGAVQCLNADAHGSLAGSRVALPLRSTQIAIASMPTPPSPR